MTEKKWECKACYDVMANLLRRHLDQTIVIFKENTYIIGIVKDIKNQSVLVLEDVNIFKTMGQLTLQINLDTLFVNICNINEFAPIDQKSSLFPNDLNH